MKIVTTTEFRKHASTFLSDVEGGNVIRIMRHGRPIAEISPVNQPKAKKPSWKRPALRLPANGPSLSEAILEERKHS